MQARISQAAEAKTDPLNFVLMARTDAAASEGLAAAIARSKAYVDAGADAIFAEALTDLEQYREFCASVTVPVLANITEFGRTPLFTVSELKSVGVAMVLYPLSAFRAMSLAAENVYQTVRCEGTQQSLVDHMQTREQLYSYLNYYEFEQAQDDGRED